MQRLLFSLFLFPLMVTGQTYDTLFYKNFDDQSIISSFSKDSTDFTPNFIGSRIDTGKNTINGTPAYSVNYGVTHLRKVLFGKQTDSEDNRLFQFNVLLPPMQKDSLILRFSINANCSPSTEYLWQTQVRKRRTVEATYQERSEEYDVYYKLPVGLQAMQPSLIDEHLDTDERGITHVTLRYLGESDGTMVRTFGFEAIPQDDEPLIVTNDGLEAEYTDNSLVSLIQSLFCGSETDVNDCKGHLVFQPPVMPTSFQQGNEFMVDDIVLLWRKPELVADISPDPFYADAPVIAKAYTLLGEPIPDITQYRGLAIVAYTNGTRSKMFIGNANGL